MKRKILVLVFVILLISILAGCGPHFLDGLEDEDCAKETVYSYWRAIINRQYDLAKFYCIPGGVWDHKTDEWEEYININSEGEASLLISEPYFYKPAEAIENNAIDEVKKFSEDLFPNYMLDWINKEISKEKTTVLKNIKIDIEIQQKKYELRTDEKELSEEQEKDNEKYGYNCKDRIYIPGTLSVNRNCIIFLNRKETKIKDANFLLLLRFVVELKKGKGGKVHLNDLEKDKTIPSRTFYQYIDRLNDDLKINVMFCKDNKKQLIKSVGAGYFRIPTHPDFVTYNLDNLLNYPDDSRIRDLAKRLEEIEKNL